jgi:hypothetical protein
MSLSTLAGLSESAWSQGACCLVDSCLPAADAAECAGLGGVFLPGEDCADDPCGVGACCFETSCNETDAYSCIINGREFAGAGTTCLDDPCGAGIGACCVDGGCSDLSPEDCQNVGGTWLGAGTNCGTDPCAPGACCLPGECQELARHECDDLGGAFVPGAECASDPCAEPTDCPDNSLFSQQRDAPDDFTAGTSEESADFRRFENFSGVAGAIDGLLWWGLDLDRVGNQWVECDEPDLTFVITFHEDAGAAPGALVCSYTLLATRTPLGIFYLGAELNEYSVTLPAPCVLVNGWVSIVGLGDPECWFLWMSAGLGESYCDNCLPSPQDFDLSLCLLGTPGGVFGACCDDSASTCSDGVEITDCTAAGLRFAPGQTCEDLDPPCGVILGACCFSDATCSIETAQGCADLGGNWLGADTLCDQCPCLTPCPPGGVPEGEPPCTDGYEDVFNGGCTAALPSFSPISLGDTVCGTSGIFNQQAEPEPDFDWYEISVAEATELIWTAEAEFRPRIWIVDAEAGCPGTVLATDDAFECEEVSVSAAVIPGTYWLVIAPWAFTDSATCPAPYTATVTEPGACPADLNGDGTVGIADLLALLAAWGTDPGGPPDLNGDGTVGIADLLILLAGWGPCP